MLSNVVLVTRFEYIYIPCACDMHVVMMCYFSPFIFCYIPCASSLTPLQIICHINGFNHVKKIAELSEVDSDIVKECVQHLV